MHTTRAELLVLSFVSVLMIALVTCSAMTCDGTAARRTASVGVAR